MSTLGSKIWYGTFPDHAEQARPHLLPGLIWTAVLLAAAGLRLLLPFHAAETQQVHDSIVTSLANGQVWGRQALVGSMEFPPLPTLALMLARTIGHWLGLPGGRLLVTTAQVWTLFYLVRLPGKLQPRLLTALMAFPLLLTPAARTAILTLDPNWITAVPAACALYHIVRWEQYHSLRDVVLLAVNCGILGFAGPAGIILALILLIVCSASLKHMSQWHGHASHQGVRLLLWTPFGYCIGLMLLANWLIMRDLFFALRHPVQAMLSLQSPAFLSDGAAALTPLPVLMAGGLVAAGIYCHRRIHIAAMSLIAGLAAMAYTRFLFAAMHVSLPAGELLPFLLAVFALLYPFLTLGNRRQSGYHGWTFAAGSITTTLTVMAALLTSWSHARPAEQPAADPPAPPPAQVTASVDRLWPEARIMVYGIRLPALYPDAYETRFVARADFTESTLLRKAREEQLYILLPPSSGFFYARGHNKLAEIHRQGSPWLLLERTWPGGWQLWRCVLVPEADTE